MSELEDFLGVIRNFEISRSICNEDVMQIKSVCATVMATYYNDLSESDFRKCVTIMLAYS